MNFVEHIKVHGVIVGYKWKLTFKEKRNGTI